MYNKPLHLQAFFSEKFHTQGAYSPEIKYSHFHSTRKNCKKCQFFRKRLVSSCDACAKCPLRLSTFKKGYQLQGSLSLSL